MGYVKGARRRLRVPSVQFEGNNLSNKVTNIVGSFQPIYLTTLALPNRSSPSAPPVI